MKLEFFQRKFWTASRQVYFKLKFSLSLNPQQLFNCGSNDLVTSTLLERNLKTCSGFTFGYRNGEFSDEEQLLDFWKQLESLLILGPNT